MLELLARSVSNWTLVNKLCEHLVLIPIFRPIFGVFILLNMPKSTYEFVGKIISPVFMLRTNSRKYNIDWNFLFKHHI